jgi:hypothetical protein
MLHILDNVFTHSANAGVESLRLPVFGSVCRSPDLRIDKFERRDCNSLRTLLSSMGPGRRKQRKPLAVAVWFFLLRFLDSVAIVESG